MQVLYTKVPDEKRNGTVTVLKIQNHRNVDLRRLLLEHYYGDSPIKSATVTYRYNPSLQLPDLADPFKDLTTSLKPLVDKRETLLVEITDNQASKNGGVVEDKKLVYDKTLRYLKLVLIFS